MNIKEAIRAQALDLIEMQTRLPGQTEPVYFKPMTLAMSDRIERECSAKGDAAFGYKLATSLVLCVLDKNGNRVFDAGDKHALMNEVPQDKLVEMCNEISGSPPSLEDAEKN